MNKVNELEIKIEQFKNYILCSGITLLNQKNDLEVLKEIIFEISLNEKDFSNIDFKIISDNLYMNPKAVFRAKKHILDVEDFNFKKAFENLANAEKKLIKERDS